MSTKYLYYIEAPLEKVLRQRFYREVKTLYENKEEKINE